MKVTGDLNAGKVKGIKMALPFQKGRWNLASNRQHSPNLLTSPCTSHLGITLCFNAHLTLSVYTAHNHDGYSTVSLWALGSAWPYSNLSYPTSVLPASLPISVWLWLPTCLSCSVFISDLVLSLIVFAHKRSWIWNATLSCVFYRQSK